MGSPFWNFSLAVYGANAVQDECLNLQDQFGLDVNLVLLCAFLGAVHGVALTFDDIASARQEVQQWHEHVVRPLRATRRHLKTAELTDAQDAAAAATIRCHVDMASGFLAAIPVASASSSARIKCPPCAVASANATT